MCGALAAVEPSVGDGAYDRFRWIFDYGIYDVQIIQNGKCFIIRLTSFSLLDLRLSLDNKLPINKF